MDSDQKRFVLRYFLERVERDHIAETDYHPEADGLLWSEREARWIKSDSVFVAFSKKTDDDDLLSELQSALGDWNPRPSRLLLTKLRAEMDEHGIAAQGQALSSRHALAYWYDRLLHIDNEPERRWRIAESVSRHSDRLISGILPRVEDFAARLIETEREASGDDIARVSREHFGVDLTRDEPRERAALEHNAFVCSMKPEGWHLTTGHVFSISDDKKDGKKDDKYWLCLSPACDMAPSQVSSWSRDVLGEQRLPFIAVELRPTRAAKVLENIHSNRFVTLQFGKEVKGFCFNDPSRDDSAPRWQVFYAENRGRFNGDGFRFQVSRIVREDVQLVCREHEASVVSQLRYEYALSLMQKLGVSLTRIGLDFVDGRTR